MPTLELTDEEVERLLGVVTTALNKERGRARYYRSEQGQLSSNTPEMEASHAQSEVDRLKALLQKLQAISNRRR